MSEKDKKKESTYCRIEGGIPVYEVGKNKTDYFGCYIPKINQIRISNDFINNIKKNNIEVEEQVKDILFINGPDLSDRDYILAYDVLRLKEAYLESEGIYDSKGRYFPYIRKYFWTHDWLAESSLIVLINSINNLFLELLFDSSKDFKFYFLLGTEAPDINQDSNRSREIELFDRDGKTYGTQSLFGPNKWGGDGNTPFKHNVFFNDDGNRVERRDAVRGAEWSFNLADKALNERDINKVAFFLGAMIYYIGDICGYPHLFKDPYNYKNSNNISVMNVIKAYWSKVGCLTCMPVRFRSQNDFFNLAEVLNQFKTNLPKKDGFHAALAVAKIINKVKCFLHEEWGISGDLWPSERRLCLNWDINTWKLLTERQKEYFSTIKFTLYSAIYFSSAAIYGLLSKYTIT